MTLNGDYLNMNSLQVELLSKFNLLLGNMTKSLPVVIDCLLHNTVVPQLTNNPAFLFIFCLELPAKR